MRVAAIVHDARGAQVVGITSDEVLRIGKQGIFEHKFGEYTLRIIVDEHAPPANPPPLDLVI